MIDREERKGKGPSRPRARDRGAAVSARRRLALAAAALALACSKPREAIIDCTPVGDARPICGFQNPEDLALLPERAARS